MRRPYRSLQLDALTNFSLITPLLSLLLSQSAQQFPLSWKPNSEVLSQLHLLSACFTHFVMSLMTCNFLLRTQFKVTFSIVLVWTNWRCLHYAVFIWHSTMDQKPTYVQAASVTYRSNHDLAICHSHRSRDLLTLCGEASWNRSRYMCMACCGQILCNCKWLDLISWFLSFNILYLKRSSVTF